MAIALPAIPLIVKFAEIAGIVVSGVATAAGLDKLSNKVETYIQENPEQSKKIFAMIMPEQGIANILKNKSSEGEEISEEELGEIDVEKKPKLTGKEKGMRIKEAIRRARAGKGNYSSPDATGSAVDIRGSVIREVEDMGIADKNLKDNYDPDKPKYDYKKFYRKRKADGGAIGLDSLLQPKRKKFNEGSNWWDTLSDQGMGVYNAMKRGGHDDTTIQNQLSMLGYYDSNSTPDSIQPNIVNQLGYQGGDNFIGYQGGDNFSPYNPDPSRIKNVKQDPTIQSNLEAIQRNQQLNSMGIKDPFANEQDPKNSYYGDMPDFDDRPGKQSMFAKAQQGLRGITGKVKGLMDSPIGNAIGFAMNPVMGGLKGIASMAENMLPANERAIQENIMGNMGFVVNDIGQIVSTGDYNDPSNVMAGYNLNKMTPATFKRRIDKIMNRRADQTDASRERIKSIREAQKQFEAAEKLKRLAVEEANLRKGRAPGGGTWQGGGGPAYTGPGGVGGGEFTDSQNNTDYQDAYDPGGGE